MALRVGLPIRGHVLDHTGVVPALEQIEHVHVGVVVRPVVDVVGRSLRLPLPELFEPEEPVRHPARCQQHDPTIALRDRLTDQRPQQQEVVRIAGLVQGDADPSRVGSPRKVQMFTVP